MPDVVVCARCEELCVLEDNFCRQCGLALHDAQLPSVRNERLPAVWRPALPTVVRGAAVIAVGTISEVLLRRFVRSVFSGSGKPNGSTTQVRDVARRDDAMPADTDMVSETLLLRRVRFRR